MDYYQPGATSALERIGVKHAGVFDSIKQLRANRAAAQASEAAGDSTLYGRIRDKVKQDEGVHLMENDPRAAQGGGGYYAPRPDPSEEFGHATKPAISVIDDDPFTLGHEYGHHQFNTGGRLGNLMSSPGANVAHGLNPLAGMYGGMVGGTTSRRALDTGDFDWNNAFKGSLAGPVLAAPRLINEGYADAQALRHLYEQGAGAKDVGQAAGGLAANVGSYGLHAGLYPGIFYAGKKIEDYGGAEPLVRAAIANIERKRAAVSSAAATGKAKAQQAGAKVKHKSADLIRAIKARTQRGNG